MELNASEQSCLMQSWSMYILLKDLGFKFVEIYTEFGQAVSKSKSDWKGHEIDYILSMMQPVLLSHLVKQDLINNNHSLIKAKIRKSYKSHLIHPEAEVHL